MGPRGLLLALGAALLGSRMPCRGQGDFDLADALDDPEPTRKPGSGLYPRLPDPPRPEAPEDPGGGHIYPPPRPQPPPPQPRPRPRPRPPPPQTDGGHDGAWGAGGDEHVTAGDPQAGSAVARIVSPIVSVVVVALLGAGVSYFRSGGRGGRCLRGRGRGDDDPAEPRPSDPAVPLADL